MDPLRSISLAGLCIFLIGLVLRYTTSDSSYDLLMIVPAVLVFGAYAVAPQIRWRYWLTHHPDLPVELAPLLDRFDLYRRLDLAGKREFRRRTFMLNQRFHFRAQGIEKLPEDVRIMAAASAVTVGYHRSEFLMEQYETVVFYPHYFPTPNHAVLHASELHEADGAVIFTLNVFLRSVVEPTKFLHLGLYEFSRALYSIAPEFDRQLRKLQLGYSVVERISGFSQEALTKYVGLPELDLAAVTYTLYFTHRQRMETLLPETVAQIDRLRAPGRLP